MPTDYSHAPSPWREVAEAAHAFMHDFESRGQGLWLALDAALKAAREAPRVDVESVAKAIGVTLYGEARDEPGAYMEAARAALRAAGYEPDKGQEEDDA